MEGPSPNLAGVTFYDPHPYAPPAPEVVDVNINEFGSRLNLPVTVLDSVEMPGPLPLPAGLVRTTALESCRQAGIEVGDPDQDIQFYCGWGLGSAAELNPSAWRWEFGGATPVSR